MLFKVAAALTVLCAVVLNTKCERSGICEGCRLMQGYTRIKRGKYYSGLPQRFYSRPPVSFPSRGVFSYTPPPNYMPEDDVPQYPGNHRPKVSRRPSSEGLGDEDITNLVKYLSKQDLDKIVEFTGGKDNSKEKYSKPSINFYSGSLHDTDQNNSFEKYNRPNTDDSKIYKASVQEIDNKQKVNTLYHELYASNGFNNGIVDTPPKDFFNVPHNNQLYSSIPLDTEESVDRNPIRFNTQNDVDKNTDNNGVSVIFTDSKMMSEEHLPKPINLRENDDIEASHTNNVPKVVKAESSSYKLENFGDLPLMDYSSKLNTLSSYHVPHYTVTSSHDNTPKLEPAPPVSAAKEQSDAHLKAIRIWSHRSKGTAYTLHNDGTLSLERPGRPKASYHNA